MDGRWGNDPRGDAGLLFPFRFRFQFAAGAAFGLGSLSERIDLADDSRIAIPEAEAHVAPGVSVNPLLGLGQSLLIVGGAGEIDHGDDLGFGIEILAEHSGDLMDGFKGGFGEGEFSGFAPEDDAPDQIRDGSGKPDEGDGGVVPDIEKNYHSDEGDNGEKDGDDHPFLLASDSGIHGFVKGDQLHKELIETGVIPFTGDCFGFGGALRDRGQLS